MHILRKLCPDIDTICGSSGNVNYKRQLKERFPEPEFQVDIKVVYRMKINSLNPIHAGVFLVLLFKIHVAPRKNFIRWIFFLRNHNIYRHIKGLQKKK